MVEDEKVQAEVMRTGKVDTIVSEPIGVMLLHERMVRDRISSRADTSGREFPPCERLVLEAWRATPTF
jgi:hypothetical protein